MSKHSPAPWMPGPNGDILSTHDGIQVVVARTWDLRHDDNGEVERANTNLIAAAPELLESLETLLEEWPKEDIEDHDDPGAQGHDADRSCFICMAREAIRKAKGE